MRDSGKLLFLVRHPLVFTILKSRREPCIKVALVWIFETEAEAKATTDGDNKLDILRRYPGG